MSSPSIPPGPAHENHPKLWFTDGDLVLSAPISPIKKRIYRIHRFILTQNSPVLCKRLEDVEKIELEVPENAALIDILLTFLYNPLSLPLKHFDPNNSLLFHQLLRLCTNYKITSLRTRIIQFLEQEWPTSLIFWDQRESYLSLGLSLASSQQQTTHLHQAANAKVVVNHDGRPYLPDLRPDPVSIVRLSRINNIPSILPIALYELSRANPNADYTHLHTHPHRRQSLQSLVRSGGSACWTLLSSEDHMCIHRGQDAIQCFLLQFLEQEESELCLLPTCIQGRMQLRAEIWSESIKRRDVLGALRSVLDGRYMADHGLCLPCTLHSLRAIGRMRQRIFQSLGEMFCVTG